jgi:hypothetical protein
MRIQIWKYRCSHPKFVTLAALVTFLLRRSEYDFSTEVLKCVTCVLSSAIGFSHYIWHLCQFLVIVELGTACTPPTPVTARSKAWVYTVRLLGLRVRIPPRAWMSVSCECLCVVRYRSLRRADHSSRGALPSVVCVWVWSLTLDNKNAPAH